MKRSTALLLALMMCLSLFACSSGGEAPAAAADLSGEITGEITVNAYESFSSKTFLEEAAKKFEEKHPGTKVTVNTFSKMPEIKTMEQDGMSFAVSAIEDDPQARQDYISKVNTDLMSGGGADIYAMDVLPGYRYAKSGQLENLLPYMDADEGFNRADYQPGILDAAQYQGGLYELPLDFMFDYLAYDDSLMTDAMRQTLQGKKTFTYQELIDLALQDFEARKGTESEAQLFGMYAAHLFQALFQENMKQFVDVEKGTVDFTGGEFVALLNTIKELEEKGALLADSSRNLLSLDEMNMEEVMAQMEQQEKKRYYFKLKNYYSLLESMTGPNGQRISYGFSEGLTENDVDAGMLSDAQGNVPFSSMQSYAMNANSTNKRTAWEFLKFLLSEEMQASSSLSFGGLPINRAALEKQARMLIKEATAELLEARAKGALDESYILDTTPLTEEQQGYYEKFLRRVDTYSNAINTSPIRDSALEDMIFSQLSAYFSGEKSAEEIASTLQSKVEIYLNE